MMYHRRIGKYLARCRGYRQRVDGGPAVVRETIMTPGVGLRAFPEPADVFVADQTGLAEHLHPLISIDLAQVDPAWHGWIHLLSPLEPIEGYVGEHTHDFHSDLQRTNWIGFAMEGDHYRLLGDVRYFAKATTAQEVPDPWVDFRSDLQAHCEAEEASYHAHRAAFRDGGELIRLDRDGSPQYGIRQAVALLDQLGGDVYPGNWADPDLFPLDDDGEQVWPLSPAGNRFHFIAAVPGWHYRNNGADSILLFFEPTERLALLTFDWS
jgi:hypothetical protein